MSLRGHHESSYAHWEAACLGKRYKGVGGVLAIVTLLKFFAHLAVDIRLIPLIAMPVLGYVSTEFEWERNADSTMHHEVCKLKNRCMHNRRGSF